MLAERLLKWYDENARVLPWRGTHDPYRIWLSEIMLQQTRAETVVSYYDRFLSAFPDVFALAAAAPDQVLKLWEGLGYYSRARNLHAAAAQIAARGGRFPESVEGLLALPGIGPYAARAIASIAYGCCVPALDGNQLRVLSRCLADERILKTPFDLEAEALQLISRSRPGDYNQALMDLGARICTPRKPQCGRCPLQGECLGLRTGEPERYPLRPAPVARREEERTVFLLQSGGGICIYRRSDAGLLGGLYDFPAAEGRLDADEAAAFLRASGFLNPRALKPLPPARHVFTHLVWKMTGWAADVDGAAGDERFADAQTMAALAFPSAIRKYREIAGELLLEISRNP